MHVKLLAKNVWRLRMCRPAQNDVCGAQTNPTPDLTLTLTVTVTLGGARGLLSRTAGAVRDGRGSPAMHSSPFIEFSCKRWVSTLDLSSSELTCLIRRFFQNLKNLQVSSYVQQNAMLSIYINIEQRYEFRISMLKQGSYL